MFTRRRFLVQSVASLIALSLRRMMAATTESTTARPLMIDSHVHVFKRDPQFPFAAGAKPPAEDASAEMLLSLMKANNVARTVIIQVIHYRWDNSYLASVLKRYPAIFHGVCRVNPEDPAAPRPLEPTHAGWIPWRASQPRRNRSRRLDSGPAHASTMATLQ
jgi:L-fuconolactonase